MLAGTQTRTGTYHALRSVSRPVFRQNQGNGQYFEGFGVDVVVVFTFHRLFYPTSSVHPVSVLIPYPREIPIRWSQTETEKAQ